MTASRGRAGAPALARAFAAGRAAELTEAVKRFRNPELHDLFVLLARSDDWKVRHREKAAIAAIKVSRLRRQWWQLTQRHLHLFFKGGLSVEIGTNMTVAQWLGILEEDAGRAWLVLWAALGRVIGGVSAQLDLDRHFVAEDARSEAFCSLMANSAPLHRAKSSTCLTTFLWGYLKNVARRQWTLHCAFRHPPADSVVSQTNAPTAEAPDLHNHCFTDKQNEVLLLLCEGRSVASIARRLDITTSAVRDRLRRAKRRMEGVMTSPARNRCECKWMTRYLKKNGAALTRSTLDLLLLRSTGATYSAIALKRGLSREAVRCRFRRMRRSASSSSG